ncbi:MAG: PAS domain S-box protein, partial [Pseudomonadota bacterium]
MFGWSSRKAQTHEDAPAVDHEQESLRQILDQAGEAVIRIDGDNTVTYFNPAAESLWGYAAADVTGRNVRMLAPQAALTGGTGWIDAQREGQSPGSRHAEIQRADGSRLTVNLSLSKVEIPGQPATYTAFLRDISAEREAGDRITQILDQAIDAVVSIDAANNITYYNKAAERLWGWSAGEVMGQNVRILVPKAIRSGHDEMVNHHRRTGQDKIVGTSRDVEIERKDGTKSWANLSLSMVKVGGEISYTAFIKDISAERARREAFRQTLEQTIDAVVTIDDKNHITFFNAAAERLWGYSRGEVIGRNIKMLVPPEMQPHHDGYVNRHRDGGEDRIVGTSREVPVHRKDGSQIWGSLSLSAIRLEDGSKSYTAFVKDVTAEVRQREQFALLSLVADETDNSVIITDPDRKILYVNRGFERITGYASAEVIGENPGKILQGRHTDPATIQRIREKLSANEAFYEEILNYSKTGEAYWVSLAINPVFGRDGKIERFVSVQANITDTKQRALQFNDRLAAIGEASALAEWTVEGRPNSMNDFFTRHKARELQLSAILSEADRKAILAGRQVRREIKWPVDSDAELWLDAIFSCI